MIRFLIFFAGLVLLTLCAPALCRVSPLARTDLTQEEYAVYSTLINERHIRGQDRLIVIINQTVSFTDENSFISRELDRHDIRASLSPVAAATIEDFKLKNQEAQQIGNQLNLNGRYLLLPHATYREIFRLRGDAIPAWEEFYRRFPNSAGFLRLSRVGFNSEMSQALIYVKHGCGSTCGTGDYVLLVKRAGAWRIEKTAPLWVS